MTGKTLLRISLVSILLLVPAMSARAEVQTGDVLSYSENADGVTAFIANPEGKKNYELDCQVGTRRPESIESHLITEDPVSVKTLILMDNSLSVRSEYRETISEILENLVENHAQNEQYTIACFSDQIDYLLEDSADYETVKDTIRNVTYKDQETYLTDILYDLLANQKKEDEPVFRRIIIVSDGVDNKNLGYTKEELTEVLKESPVPIYTLGCSSNNNEEQLKAMLALSRSSKGEGFLLDDLEDVTDFIRSVKQTDYTIRADIRPQKEDMDGTRKGIRITLSTDDGTVQSTFSADMPFAEISDMTAEVTESAEETVPETTAASAEQPTETTAAADAPEPEAKENSLLPILIIAAVIVLAGAAAVVIIGKKKKKKAETEDDDQDLDETPTVLTDDDETPTELASYGDDPTVLAAKVIALYDESGGIADEMSAEISRVLVVGRRKDCDIVIPEKTVSRQQFEIGCEGDTVWIRNLSDHGTLVNGERVEGRTEICSGDRITAGNMKLKVEIRN